MMWDIRNLELFFGIEEIKIEDFVKVVWEKLECFIVMLRDLLEGYIIILNDIYLLSFGDGIKWMDKE